MSTNGKRGYVVDAILLVVFTVIAFAPPFVMTPTFWLGYLCGVIAILAQIYFFTISFSKGEEVKSKFYGFPIARIGVIYMGVQLVISLIEMAASAFIPTWVALVVNILPIAFAAIGSIAADIMRDEIVRQEVELKKDVHNISNLQSLSASFPGMCQDSEVKKVLQDLADEFRFSDPVSSEHTLELEGELKVMLNEIQSALIAGDYKRAQDLSARTKATLSERNRVCKLNK